MRVVSIIANKTTITFIISKGESLAYFIPIWLGVFDLIWLIVKGNDRRVFARKRINMLPLSKQIHNLETILKTQELSTHIKQDLKKEIQRLKQELAKQEGINKEKKSSVPQLFKKILSK